MKSKSSQIGLLLIAVALLAPLGGCKSIQADAAAEAPPAAKVVPFGDAALFPVERPDQFPLAAATAHATVSELIVTGIVTPDVSRNVPVVSLASGRVMAIHARLGDTVQKGQVLLTIRSDDVSNHIENGSIVDEPDVIQGIVLLRKGAEEEPTLEAIHKKVDQLNNGILPPGVKVVPMLDRSDLLHSPCTR